MKELFNCYKTTIKSGWIWIIFISIFIPCFSLFTSCQNKSCKKKETIKVTKPVNLLAVTKKYEKIDNKIRSICDDMHKLYSKVNVSYNQASEHINSNFDFILKTRLSKTNPYKNHNYTFPISYSMIDYKQHIKNKPPSKLLVPILDSKIKLSKYEKNCLTEVVLYKYKTAGNYCDTCLLDQKNTMSPPWIWIKKKEYRTYSSMLLPTFPYLEANILHKACVDYDYVIKYLKAKGIHNPNYVIKALGNDTISWPIRDKKLIYNKQVSRFVIHETHNIPWPNRGFFYYFRPYIDINNDVPIFIHYFENFNLTKFHQLEIDLISAFWDTYNFLITNHNVSNQLAEKEAIDIIEDICNNNDYEFVAPENRNVNNIHPILCQSIKISESDKKTLLESIAENVYMFHNSTYYYHYKNPIVKSLVDYDYMIKYLKEKGVSDPNYVIKSLGNNMILVKADNKGVVYDKKILFYVKYDNIAF